MHPHIPSECSCDQWGVGGVVGKEPAILSVCATANRFVNAGVGPETDSDRVALALCLFGCGSPCVRCQCRRSSRGEVRCSGYRWHRELPESSSASGSESYRESV